MPHTLAILQGYIDNQGDAWNYALDYLRRTVDELAVAVDTEDAFARSTRRGDAVEGYSDDWRGIIGRRLGELHVALASPTDDPAFAPQRATQRGRRRTGSTARTALLASALDILAQKHRASSASTTGASRKA